MCLYRKKRAERRFRNDHTEDEDIVVWKVYSVCDSGDVYPPYSFSVHSIAPGFTVSNRVSQDKDSQDDRHWVRRDEINRGIHVFLTKAAAQAAAEQPSLTGWAFIIWLNECGRSAVFKCTARLSDLVAVGIHSVTKSPSAVFMKIHITKEDFEKGRS